MEANEIVISRQDVMSVFAKVRRIVADELFVDEKSLRPELSLENDCGADSLDVLIIVSKIEKEFDVRLNINSNGWNTGSTLYENCHDVACCLKSNGLL